MSSAPMYNMFCCLKAGQCFFGILGDCAAEIMKPYIKLGRCMKQSTFTCNNCMFHSSTNNICVLLSAMCSSTFFFESFLEKLSSSSVTPILANDTSNKRGWGVDSEHITFIWAKRNWPSWFNWLKLRNSIDRHEAFSKIGVTELKPI